MSTVVNKGAKMCSKAVTTYFCSVAVLIVESSKYIAVPKGYI